MLFWRKNFSLWNAHQFRSWCHFLPCLWMINWSKVYVTNVNFHLNGWTTVTYGRWSIVYCISLGQERNMLWLRSVINKSFFGVAAGIRFDCMFGGIFARFHQSVCNELMAVPWNKLHWSGTVHCYPRINTSMCYIDHILLLNVSASQYHTKCLELLTKHGNTNKK